MCKKDQTISKGYLNGNFLTGKNEGVEIISVIKGSFLVKICNCGMASPVTGIEAALNKEFFLKLVEYKNFPGTQRDLIHKTFNFRIIFF